MILIHAYGDEHGFVALCGVEYPHLAAARWEDVTCRACRIVASADVEPDYDHESIQDKLDRCCEDTTQV
ncbi:MAG TPA: hypothetical protein VGJ80_06255, partial [Gemmatimonadales bacterium]